MVGQRAVTALIAAVIALCTSFAAPAWADPIDTIPARSIHDDNELAVQDDSPVPSAYSSVAAGFVTPVKDQGPFGTCWAFSSLAALESSLLARGQVTDADAIDLSERHLAYFTYHAVTDPLGYTIGDSTKPASTPYMDSEMRDRYLGAGGNPCMAAYTLASWRGCVNEEEVPYSELVSAYWRAEEARWSGETYSYDDMLADTALDPSIAYAYDGWHLTDMRQIALTDEADVKKAIMQHGAAALLMYYDEQYLNPDTNAYYYHGPYDTNHGVTIEGWDDSYSAENFKYDPAWAREAGITVSTKTRVPSRDGAWLIKNSYGPYSYEDGYFWLSYEDTCRYGRYSKAYVFDAAPADEFDNLYQHDGATVARWNSLPSGGSIANVYTARAAGADETCAEALGAVAFALDDVNVDYRIQVYLDLADAADPTSGHPALAQPVAGRTDYTGYYTVELPYPVPLTEGSAFSVVVTLSHANRQRVCYSVDTDDSTWDWVTFHSEVHAHESFEQATSDGEWVDLSARRSDSYGVAKSAARVKALTRTVGLADLPALPIDQAEVQLNPSSMTYAGSPLTPSVAVTYGGETLAQGYDYEVAYADNDSPGTGSVVVSGIGRFTGQAIATFEITERAANPLKASVAKQVVNWKALQKQAAKLDAITVKKAKGKVTFAKVKGASSKGLSVNAKTGVVKVRKGLARGTYRLRVRVSAAGNARYAPGRSTITCKVRVT